MLPGRDQSSLLMLLSCANFLQRDYCFAVTALQMFCSRCVLHQTRGCDHYTVLWLHLLDGSESVDMLAACLLSLRVSHLKIQMENENEWKLWVKMYRKALSALPDSSPAVWPPVGDGAVSYYSQGAIHIENEVVLMLKSSSSFFLSWGRVALWSGSSSSCRDELPCGISSEVC